MTSVNDLNKSISVIDINEDEPSLDFAIAAKNKSATKGSIKRGGGGVKFKSSRSMEEVLNISRISNYNMEEVISYWGESDEHILRKSELKKAVRDMYYHRRDSDRDFTKLGIEDKVGAGKAQKSLNRFQSRNAVLDEQDLQYHEGVFDDDLLADIYSATTYDAAQSAQQKAAKLHEDVKDDDDDDDDEDDHSL